jgi:hypothetical protein
VRSTKDTRILDDQRVDELLAGAQPAGAPELRGLGAAIVVIRDTWGDSEVDLARAANVASDLAAAAVEAEGDYVRPPVATGRRRRKVAAGLAGGLAASLLLTGGLAAAEVLPDDAQRVVADLGDAVGVDLPEPASDKAVDATSKDKAKDEGTEEGEGGEATHPDNHGKQVSEAAHDHSRDEECGNHGKAVSSVARGEETCTPPGDGEAGEGDAEAPEAEGDAEKGADGATQGKPEDAPAGTKPEVVPPVPPAPPAHANASDDAEGAEPPVPSDAAQDRGRPEEG